MMVVAARYITAPEISMFMLLDIVLVPLWVWVGGFGAPLYYAYYCGAVVMVALFVHSYLALTEATPNNPHPYQSLATAEDDAGAEEEDSAHAKD